MRRDVRADVRDDEAPLFVRWDWRKDIAAGVHDRGVCTTAGDEKGLTNLNLCTLRAKSRPTN